MTLQFNISKGTTIVAQIRHEVADKQRRLVEVDVNFIEEITVSHARRE